MTFCALIIAGMVTEVEVHWFLLLAAYVYDFATLSRLPDVLRSLRRV